MLFCRLRLQWVYLPLASACGAVATALPLVGVLSDPLQLDDHLQQRLSTKKMPSWEDLMNCVCMNGGGAQRPGVQEVIDTLQRSSVCTGTQCFETEAE